jgi:hypothetical protein
MLETGLWTRIRTSSGFNGVPVAGI